MWIPLAVLAWVSVWLFESLTRQVSACGLTTIDTRCSRLDPGSGFADERWASWMSSHLARFSEISALDREGLESLAGEIRALPFVAEVGDPRVVWPDGFEVPVRLRAPAACVRVGTEFLAVSVDGVLLPGTWSAPPKIERKYLPVIGPNDRSFDHQAPGAHLSEARHLDALAVAISMRAFLTTEDFDVLGPPLIDATTARRASVSEPGVVIKLEGYRLVLFGRAPDSGEPGELPVEFKWASLAKALDDLRSGDPARDWSVLDVRWDVPSIQWRALEAPAEAARAR